MNWSTVILLTLLGGLGSAFAQSGERALNAIGVDAGRATIPVEDILSGGPPPQGIPALGFGGDHAGAAGPSPAPQFVTPAAASAWLDDEEPVIALSLGGESRAYPLQVLTWHEIVNDTLGGVPVAVTFCPLCNSALAFDRRVPLDAEGAAAVRAMNPEASVEPPDDAFTSAFGGASGGGLNAVLPVTFGVSGLLYNSNLLMFDTASSTLWSQLTGEGAVGTLSGVQLVRYPAQIVSFGEFRAAFSDARVLSRETGFSRDYGRNPYVGYDRADEPPFLFSGELDGRLPPKARVITFERAGDAAAFPFTTLQEARVVNTEVGGEPVAVFWQEGTTSALDASSIAGSEDVGAAGVFDRRLDGESLTFAPDGEFFVDEQTGSSWNLLGQAVSGELSGAALSPITHDNTLWFAWAAFRPDTRIVGAE